MDRREFFGLSGSMAGASVLKSAGLRVKDTETEPLAQVGSLLRAAFGAQAGVPGVTPLTVSISSEFMEDYTAGSPWMGTFAKVEVPYISRNGTAQLYSFAGRWMGITPEVMERVYADPDPEKFPGQDTMTGWTSESKPLPTIPPQFANQKLGYDPPTAFIITDVDYRPSDPVVLSGDERKPDMLFVYRDESLYSAPLGDDGSVGEWVNRYTHPNPPLVRGPLPAGTQYIFEGPRGINCTFEFGNWPYGCRPSIGFHDVVTGESRNLDYTNLFTQSDTVFQKVFPLTCTTPGEYSCVALELHGNVTYFHLKLDGDTFHLVGGHPILLGNSANGLVGVSEGPGGTAQVFLFDLPRIRTFEIGGYDGAGTLRSHELPAVDIQDYQFPNYPSGTTLDLICHYNPVTAQPEVFLTVQEPLTRGDGSHPDPLSELWSTSRRQTGWEPLTLIDVGLRNVVAVAGPSPALFVQRARTGYEYWTRNEGGDWDTSHVRVERELGQMLESAGYRVGITMKRNGAPISSGEIEITTSVATTAIIEGRHGILGMHRPWRASCDSTGTLWVTVLLEDRTAFPSLVLTSKFFPDRLVLDLNHRIGNLFTNITEDQLLNARDPRRCREEESNGCSVDEVSSGLDTNSAPLISDRKKAENASEMIRKTLQSAPKPAQLPQSSSAQVKVESKIPWGWLARSADLKTLHPVMASNAGPSWRVYRKDGVAQLELVSSSEARARMAELNAAHRVWKGGTYFGMFDFISDAFDAIGDIAKDIYDGASQLVEAVVDGLKVTIKLFIDGLEWVYNAVMDTIDMVMDAIDFVLEYAGMALGMAVGWLLEQLGFLFDWKAIKQRKDQLRNFLSSNLRPALNKIGSPQDSVAGWKKKLLSFKGTMREALNTLRSSPVDERIFDNSPGQSDAFGSFSFISGVSVLPQLTWLLDKVQSVLPRSASSLSIPSLPGMDGLVETLINALLPMADSLSSVFTDFIHFFDEWIVQGKLFTAAAFDPFIDLLLKLIGRIVDMFAAILDAGAGILQTAWKNAEAFLNSFDNTLSVPAFFRGFYKGLVGSDCSALDLVCLLTAIPSYAERSEPLSNSAGNFDIPQIFGASPNPGTRTHREVPGPQHAHMENASWSAHTASRDLPFNPFAMGNGGGPPYSEARTVAICFSSVSAAFAGLATGASIVSTPGTKAEDLADMLTYLNLVCVAGFQIANLADESHWELAAGSGLASIVAILLGILYKSSAKIREMLKGIKTKIVDSISIAQLYAGLVAFCFAIAEFATKSFDEGVSDIMSCLQLFIGSYTRAELRPGDPKQAVLWGVITSGLVAGRTTMYALRPISG